MAGEAWVLRWLPTLAALVGLVFFTRLGLWQLDRAEEKASLQASFDAAAEAPAETLIRYHPVPRFQRVRVQGNYRHDATLLLDNQIHQGRVGVHVITPLDLGDGPLLVLCLVAAYQLGFHWFFQRHYALDGEIDHLLARESKSIAALAQQPALQERLQAAQIRGRTEPRLLSQNSANLARSELREMVKEAVSRQAGTDHSCSLVSSRTLDGRDQERFRKAAIGIRLQCELEPLHRVLHQLENAMPYVFLDDLRIDSREAGSTRPKRNPVLDVRFALSGYWKPAAW